jgi:hypothetical protein
MAPGLVDCELLQPSITANKAKVISLRMIKESVPLNRTSRKLSPAANSPKCSGDATVRQTQNRRFSE